MGKVWLVTGASRGLGREITRAALEAGETVVATARSADAVRDACGGEHDPGVAWTASWHPAWPHVPSAPPATLNAGAMRHTRRRTIPCMHELVLPTVAESPSPLRLSSTWT